MLFNFRIIIKKKSYKCLEFRQEPLVKSYIKRHIDFQREVEKQCNKIRKLKAEIISNKKYLDQPLKGKRIS